MFGIDPVADAVVRGLALTVVALVWVLVLVRVVGLRSFSKMTAFDFVVTLATASLLATAASAGGWVAYIQSMVAIAALLLMQVLLALARRWDAVRRVLENEPVLLVVDGAFDERALRRTRVSRADVLAKLRQANVASIADVRAVVLETTGDISILHGHAIDPALITDVRRAG